MHFTHREGEVTREFTRRSSTTRALSEGRGVEARLFYSAAVPENIEPVKKYPLIVFLHGSGNDDRGQLSSSHNGFIQIAPRARGTSNAYCTEHAQDDIHEAIDDAIANYPIDTTRIILAGFSMGGYGVYRTFYETPHRFRALAVFSGHPDIGNKYLGSGHPNFLERKYLAPFKGKNIFIFHGGQDRNCPLGLTEKVVALLKEVGARVEFHVEKDKGHENPSQQTYERYADWLKRVIQD